MSISNFEGLLTDYNMSKLKGRRFLHSGNLLLFSSYHDVNRASSYINKSLLLTIVIHILVLSGY